MTLLALTPVNLTAGGASPTNLTSSLTSIASNTGVTFTNTGREILVVSVGGTPTTLTSDIPLTIQGEPVTGQSSGALTTSAISIVGPFPSQFDRTDGTYTVEIDFSSQTSISVALLHVPGVT